MAVSNSSFHLLFFRPLLRCHFLSETFPAVVFQVAPLSSSSSLLHFSLQLSSLPSVLYKACIYFAYCPPCPPGIEVHIGHGHLFCSLPYLQHLGKGPGHHRCPVMFVQCVNGCVVRARAKNSVAAVERGGIKGNQGVELARGLIT